MRLIDADELLRKYSVYKGQRIPEKDFDNFPITINISDVKDAIRKAPTMGYGDWISVDDRLPKQSGWYLVCIHGWVTEAWFDSSDRRWSDFATCKASSDSVARWQPLPEPPKEGE